MGRGPCQIWGAGRKGAGPVFRKREQGTVPLGGRMRPLWDSPAQTVWRLPAIGYLVLFHEPDGGRLVCPAVLTAHQWLLLLHPVLQL